MDSGDSTLIILSRQHSSYPPPSKDEIYTPKLYGSFLLGVPGYLEPCRFPVQWYKDGPPIITNI